MPNERTDPGAIPTAPTPAQRADMEAHAIVAEGAIVRNLGPGETPKRAPDEVHPDGVQRRHGAYIGSPSLEEAERFGNPIVPYDSSGHKVHPSDAFSKPIYADVEQARAFGGSGGTLEPGKNYRVVEKIDPVSGELVRTKLGMNGEVLDEQREPGPNQRTTTAGVRHGETTQDAQQRQDEERRRQYRRDTEPNGPVL